MPAYTDSDLMEVLASDMDPEHSRASYASPETLKFYRQEIAGPRGPTERGRRYMDALISALDGGTVRIVGGSLVPVAKAAV
jgi:hypothetical protein